MSQQPWKISLAETDSQLVRCHAVMRELRPHITLEGFPERVRRQNAQAGYRIVMLEDSKERVLSVAGFRVGEYLAWGRAMYVDDLVTVSHARSTGCGRAIFEWLVEFARRDRCDQLHLDSGVQRFAAHRFYLARRMDITSHHFALPLAPVGG